MTIRFTYDPTEWRSSDRSSQHKYTERLAAGDIIVLKREPYRIHEITPRPHVDWTEQYLAAWQRAGRPDPEGWWSRPFVLVLGKEGDPQSKQRWHVEVACSRNWTVLAEHYSVCRLCGELPPCRHEHTEAVMEHATAQMAKTMSILPGFCHGCKEPITRRQGSVRYEGENLIRPDLGNNSAIFHTRNRCWSAAEDYEDRWAPLHPDLPRKLSCDGPAVTHLDGTLECEKGELCPGGGGEVSHRSWQSHWPARDGMPGSNCWCAGVDAAVLAKPPEDRSDA